MRIKLAIAVFVLVSVSVLAIYSWADAGSLANDPVEVVRAEVKANLAGGDWRIYLSKRWQDVITPTVMNGLNYFYATGPNALLRNELAKHPPKDKNIIRHPIDGVNSVTPDLDDVKLVQATETTAMVDCYLSFSGPDLKKDGTWREYLIKEDGRWAVDTIFPNVRPEWAIPADIKPIHDEIAKVIQQYYGALFDTQGRAIRDSSLMEAFAKKNLSDESLATVGIKRYVEKNWRWNRLDAVTRDKCLNERKLLSPVVVDVRKTQTLGQAEYANVGAFSISCYLGDKGEIKTVSGCQGFFFVKEHGEWKLGAWTDEMEFASRFLDLWRERDRDTMRRLLTPDARFDLGGGKSLTWAQVLKNLPVLASVDRASDLPDWNGTAHYVRLNFTGNGSICKSGVYELVFRLGNAGTIAQNTRIASVRYLNRDAIAAENRKLIAVARMERQPARLPVKPMPTPPAKLLPPPADLPIELRHKGDRGGIYFDDILLKNDGKAVFFDDFQSGNLSGWTEQDDAKVECSTSNACCLYANQQGRVVSMASHEISIVHPGVVELSAWVWLPPISEQISEFTDLVLYSGSSDDNISAGVVVDRRGKGYLVKLHWNRSDGDNKDAESKGSVLQSGKWARLALRLDCKSNMASAMLDSIPQARMHYAPSNFRTIDMISVWGWLGTKKVR